MIITKSCSISLIHPLTVASILHIRFRITNTNLNPIIYKIRTLFKLIQLFRQFQGKIYLNGLNLLTDNAF